MKILGWIVGTGIVGGLLVRAGRNAKREREEENRRRNTPCRFMDGITQEEFESIALYCAKRIKRVSEISVSGPIVLGIVQSQSGISEWSFKIDYNDYGHLTGKYWLSSENADSSIPKHIADAISEAIQNHTIYQDDEYDEDPDEASPIIQRPTYGFCPYCGKGRTVKNAPFCSYCGSKID